MTVPVTLNPRRRLHRTAVHEAGHAVLAIAGGNGLDHITVLPADGRLGMTSGQLRWGPSVQTWSKAERRRARFTMAELLAGAMAVARFRDQECSLKFLMDNGGEQDFDRWLDLAASGTYATAYAFDAAAGGLVQDLDNTVRHSLRHSLRLADRTFERHWPAVLQIAARLVIQRNMRGDQAKAIFTCITREGA